MRIDQELKLLLIAELGTIIEGWNQYTIASMLGVRASGVGPGRQIADSILTTK